MFAHLRDPRLLALLDQCLVSGCNFFVLLYLGRKMGAEDFGLFSLAMMSSLFLANLHRALLTRPLNILGAAEGREQQLQRLTAVLQAHLLAIPLAAAILFALSLLFFAHTGTWLSCAAFVACFYLQESMRRYWYTRGDMRRALRSDAVAYCLQLLFLLLAGSQLVLDATWAFAIMAAPFALAFLLDLGALNFRTAKANFTVASLLRQHWTLARWLVMTVFAVWGAGQLYPFLLVSLGPVAVASFMASRNLLNVINLAVQSVDNYLPSRIVVLLREEGPVALRQHLQQTLLMTSALGVIFVLVISWSADVLLHLVYAGAYDDTGAILRILSLGAFCAFIGTVLGTYSLAMHDSRASFLSNLGASVSTFTIGLWLVQVLGVTGAAWGATLSFATAMLLQGAFVLSKLAELTRCGAARA